ncbi:hypothetical protein CYPRO_1090 [Cyclonatronum proteinivorum]|uniref:Uncharacterized protein n=1 Tax=Cyclonatronum proteinivorum TaxID=1457365 RepID=A0A345UIQ3_9BACT|nr:hypothetical protein [Cyclonatronum proteinivorum]AXJ00355.1 hypothetical protein CYPRO_1090 [Cyclonatronum proteinivorum]
MKLYFNEDGAFGIQPPNPDEWIEYETPLNNRINLKEDLGYKEVKDLAKIIQKSDIWNNFPAQGYTLVGAEFKGGDEDQRIDFLYLREDGAVLPCELKIGGNSHDSHGQLLRYISDLFYQDINIDYLNIHNDKYLAKIVNDTTRNILKRKYSNFIKVNNLTNKEIRLLPKSGLLIDEDFKTQLKKTVRYLNDYCGFSIQMIQIEAYVDTCWEKSWSKFKMRWDFIEIS